MNKLDKENYSTDGIVEAINQIIDELSRLWAAIEELKKK